MIGDGTGGLSSISGDPLLAPLGYYGGPTETMPLLPGSAAIGSGTTFDGITKDQRGFERPSSGIDIGAFQSEPPPTLTISGTSTIADTNTYSLSLSATFPSSDNGLDSIQSWSINWGDGTTQSPDTQTVYGNPSSVTHGFPDQAGNYSITATAVDLTGTTYPALNGGAVNVAVTGGSPLEIVGPNTGTTNSAIQLQATGGNVSPGSNPLDYTWDVTDSGNPVASGTGSTFSFVPQTTGSYLVVVIAIGDPAGPSSATDTITVAAAQNNIIPINGPSVLEVGHTAAFSFNPATVFNFFGTAEVNQWRSTVINTGAATAGPAINWVISKGGTTVYTSPTAYFFYNDQDDPSIRVPPDIFFAANSTGSYTVSLQLTYGGTTYFQNAETLQAVTPAEHDFISTVLPNPSTTVGNTVYDFQSSLEDAVVQPDGKIVIASQIGITDSSHDDYEGGIGAWAVTRLNSDLSVDTSFGNNGTVITSLPGTIVQNISESAADSSGIELNSNVHLAIDLTGRILVGVSLVDSDGSAISPGKHQSFIVYSDGINLPFTEETDSIWTVARYTPCGVLDDSFGSDHTGIVEEESPDLDEFQTMALGNNGEIYLGGAGYAFASSPIDLGFVELTYRPCFAVMCLGDNGELSTTFGNTGIGEDSLGLDLIPVASDSQVQYPGYDIEGDIVGPVWGSEAITSMIVESNGDIVAGGFSSQVSEASWSVGDMQNWSFWDPSTSGSSPPLTGFSLVRLNSDGSLDDTFGAPSGVGDQRTGKAPIEYFTASVDGSFNDAWLRSISLDSQGNIVAMGMAGPMWFPAYSAGENFALARYLPDGSLDTSFGSNSDGLVTYATGDGNVGAYSGVITDSGEIVVAGTSETGDGVIAAFTANGVPDTSYFGSDTNDSNNPADFEPTIPGSGSNLFAKIISLTNNDLLMVGGGDSTAEPGTDYWNGPPGFDEIVVAEYTPQVLKVGNLEASATPAGPIDLQWQNLGSGQDGFEILRSTAIIDGDELDSPTVVGYSSADETTYADATALPDTTYYYQVVAYGTNPTTGSIVPGGASNIASASTAPLNASYVLVEVVPVDINGTATTSSISLAPGYYQLIASGYFDLGGPGGTYRADSEYAWYTSGIAHDIEPGKGGVDYGINVTEGDATLSPSASSLKSTYWGPLTTTADHSYSIGFRVTGDTSTPLSFRYFDDNYPDNEALTYPMQVAIYAALPSSPGNLQVTPDRTDKEINLSWIDDSSDDGSIVVQRAEYDSGTIGAFATIATLPAGSTSFSDVVSSNLPDSIGYNVEYAYRLVAQTSIGVSAPSNTAYAVLPNQPPQITHIPNQIAYVGTEFLYSVGATDPQDGRTGLTYSLSGGPEGMTIDSNGTISGWTPTQAELDSYFGDESWEVGVTVNDAEGSATTVPMMVQVAPPSSAIPHTDDGGVAAHVVSQTASTITLSVTGVDSTSNDGSDISYTWETIAQPAQAGIPTFSVNGTNGASETVATIYGAGTYKFKVIMTNGNGWPGASDVTANVTQELTNIHVTPILSAIVAGTTTPLQFKAEAVDQFNFAMSTQPTIDWSIDPSSTAGGTVTSTGTTTASYTPPTSISGSSGNVLIDATVTGSTASHDVSVTVTANADTAPQINSDQTDANPISFTQLQLKGVATDPLNPGTDSHLIYSWQITPTSGNSDMTDPVLLSDNNSNSAKSAIATIPTGANFDYQILLTVINSIGQSSQFTLTLSDVRNFTDIAVTPSKSSIGEGGTVTLSAVAEDQYGRPVAPAPTLSWSLDGGTTTIATGGTYTYTAPNTPGDYTVTVEDSTGLIVENATIDVVAPGPPTMNISSPHASSDSQPVDINSAKDIDIVSYNPDGDAAPWSLWLMPQNAPSGTQPIELANGDASTDQYGNPVKEATLDPAEFANGVYELDLKDGDGNIKDHTLVSIDSTLKLGNLTLPITDLTVNTPGSQPIAATRIYDSSQANVDSTSLGYGWKLNLSGTDFHTTVQPGADDGDSTPGFADGNLVYITLPNGQQHVFEFVAQLDPNAVSVYEGLTDSISYYTPNFLCVDGSGATLSVSPDISDTGDNADSIYDGDPIILKRQNGYYVDVKTDRNYNPVDSLFAGSSMSGQAYDYTLQTADGSTYVVNPSNGQIVAASDPNGNPVNYTSTFTKHSAGAAGQITSITDAANQTVDYVYDDTAAQDTAGTEQPNLIGVISPTGSKTTYQYGDELVVQYDGTSSSSVSAVISNTDGKVWDSATSAWVTTGTPSTYAISLTGDTDAETGAQYQWYFASAPSGISVGCKVTINYYAGADFDTPIYTESRAWSVDGAHQLTAIIDPRGVKALTATYVDASGQLASLQQTNEKSSPVQTGGLDSNDDNSGQAEQTVIDSAGDTTEEYYDPQGDVIRKIQTLKDPKGNVTGYEVTVTDYNYVTDFGSPQDTGTTNYNLLNYQTSYAPFETTTLADAQSQRPDPSTFIQTIQYVIDESQDPGHYDTDRGMPISVTENLGNGLTRVTSYQNYVDGKPQDVSVQLVSNGTTDVGSAINTTSDYDSHGNLIWTEDSTGQYTVNTYTDGTGGVPAGLLLDTYRGSSSNATEDVLMSSNTYYSTTTASLGAVEGMLASSTTYDYTGSGEDAVQSNQTTYYAYDALGDQVLSYTPKTWSTSDGSAVKGWTVNITQYDLGGRTTDTWQATYVDTSTGTSIAPLSFTLSAPSSTDTGIISISEPIYVDSTQTSSMSGSPLQTSHTDYSPAGEAVATTDQYGQKTYSIYDLNGNLVDTIYPDHTEVRTVYDSLGRIVLQTDRYATTTTVNSTTDLVTSYDKTTVAPLATVTQYNSLGQAYSTQEYSNVLVTMSGDSNAPASSGIEVAALSGSALTPQSSNFISSTQTWFDDQGRAIETKNAAGLRTGTIYNADGSVAFTGPLNTTAPDGGEVNSTTDVTSLQLSDFASYTQYLYDQVDASSGNPWSGLVYNEIIDTDGHYTKTFQDAQGRTIFTVYEDTATGHDGSYTQTVYSVGDQAITSASLPTGISSPSGLEVPAGGSETVTITEVNDGLVATFDVYDLAGNLTDVWQPPVADALNSGTAASPHTHYDYDASGNEIGQIDAKGNETTFAHDENGNQVKETLPSPDGTTSGASEETTYDQFGRELTHTDYDGNVASYTYYTGYGSGAYLGSVEQIAYTPVGGLSSDETVTYRYDSLGREDTVTDVTSAGTRTDTYTYDPITGHQTSVTTSEGTVNHTYDPATGLLTRTWTTDGAEDENFAYDSQGRLQTVTVTKLDNLTVHQVTTYTYDAVGNLMSTTTNTGSGKIIATYTYDDQNRLTELVNKDGSDNVLGSYTYTLDDDGNRTQVVEVDSTGATRTVHYQYDADSRLTEEKVTDSTGNHTTDYTYDLVGNRITQTDSTGTTNYAYNNDDELTVETPPAGSAIDYTYDANGSETGESGGVSATYVYDDRNRLVSATVNGTTQTYTYDDNGDRVSMTTGGATTLYEVDDQSTTGYPQVAAEINASTSALVVGYAWGEQLIAQDRGGTSSLYLYDGHGSVRALASVTAAVTDTYTYNAFGVLTVSTGSTTNLYQFAMMRSDGATGMYYDNARYYIAPLDRFNETDPPGYGNNVDPISLHKYLYATANPVGVVDPSGDWPMTLGSSVNNWLSKQFELPGGGAIPGSLRFGNRWVSTILRRTVGYAGPPIPFRPDAVEFYKNALGANQGDIYEFKPGPITLLANPLSIAFAATNAIGQIASYTSLLTIAPQGNWQAGSLLWPGVKAWPLFFNPLQPPGSTLVTFNTYVLAKGVIFYDFVSTQIVRQLVTAALTAGGVVGLIKLLAIEGATATGVRTAATIDSARLEATEDIAFLDTLVIAAG